MKYFVLISVGVFIILGCTIPGITSSGNDTCTQGENMTNPRLVNGLEEWGDVSSIRITWDAGSGKGANLPAAYYQAVRLDGEAGVITTVELTAEREITVEFIDLAMYLLDKKNLELTLLFPDRRDFITCRHGGMDDIYFLKVSLFFTSNGAFDHVEFEQGVWLGPI